MYKNTKSVQVDKNMDFKPLIKKLERALKEKLPGEKAQNIMSPVSGETHVYKKADPAYSLKAAVLICFYPEKNNIYLPLIKRPKYGGVHSGQIAFPGGRYEDHDTCLTETALREAQEEIGIDPRKIILTGQLSKLYIPPSNYLVTPIVGFTENKPDFIIDPLEVDQLLIFNLSDLLDKNASVKSNVMTALNLRMDVPSFFIKGHVIWGATAMIISELITVIKNKTDVA